MTDSELLELADLNLAESSREMARWQSGHHIEERDDLLLICGSNPFPVSYTSAALALGHSPVSDPAAILETANDFFDRRQRGYTLWIRDHLDSKLQKAAEAAGFTRMTSGLGMPGLVLDAACEERPLQEGVRVEVITSSEGINQMASVLADAYTIMGLPKENTPLNFANPDALLRPHITAVLGWVDDQPAGAAISSLSHGIAGIYWVGTVPDARGRGIGEACTRLAGNAAFEQGARHVVLQASDMGDPIYRRMGYRELTRYAWYVHGYSG